MDDKIYTADYENNQQALERSFHDLVDASCQQACDAIAPSWPLDQSIAVNPHWKRVYLPVRDVAARMAVLANIHVFPKRDYIKEAWHSGRIQTVDLEHAIATMGEKDQFSPQADACVKMLDTPLNIQQLPLLIDVLDNDPKKHTRLSWRQAITHQVSQTCAAYFDHHQADWQPDRKHGLYEFWRDLLIHDHGIGTLMGLPDLGKHLHALPPSAKEAEAWVIKRLGLPEYAWPDYLEALLLTVNGWASWCAYLGWQAHLKGQSSPHLRDLLAIRLAWGAILLECKDTSEADHAFSSLKERWKHVDAFLEEAEKTLMYDELWQIALEHGYQRSLQASLSKAEPASKMPAPEVQAAFCIDVRSEPIRRRLEQVNPNIQTIGFAGFFGLPVAYSPLGTTLKRPQLPGLLAPALDINERLFDADTDEQSAHQLTEQATKSRTHALARVAQLNAGVKWPGSAFSYVEAAGISYLGKLKRWIKPPTATRENTDYVGITKRYRAMVRPVLNTENMHSRVDLAAQVLNAMGLKKQFAPIVLLVGHGSHSVNNAHAASLDCGACCGQTGEVNARALAQLLNDSDVRKGLHKKGLHIPSETAFIAALHNTTTDEIYTFDTDLLTVQAQDHLHHLTADLKKAGDLVRRERALNLEYDHRLSHDQLLAEFRERANDGAQTRPEWGLAGNAAFIIAPRHRTKGIPLAGRTFLHDYDANEDNDGALLELLMTAPMLVTHWINWQYHASTCDPAYLGAGNKILHNVVGGHIGVFEGNGGDLRIGLSKQSLHDGKRWMHEPLRLTVVIDAPEQLIERIVAKHAILTQLVNQGWLHLWCFSGNTLKTYTNHKWMALK